MRTFLKSILGYMHDSPASAHRTVELAVTASSSRFEVSSGLPVRSFILRCDSVCTLTNLPLSNQVVSPRISTACRQRYPAGLGTQLPQWEVLLILGWHGGRPERTWRHLLLRSAQARKETDAGKSSVARTWNKTKDWLVRTRGLRGWSRS